MEKKYKANSASNAGIANGPERNAFYTPACSLDEDLKQVLRINGSQFFGFKKPLKKEAWLIKE